MPWNSTSPDGSISVASNRTKIQDNFTWIETKLGNTAVGTSTSSTRDHFWNVSATLDGRHRFIQSPIFTVGSLPVRPSLGTGMDAMFFLSDGDGIPQWYHGCDEQTTYQVTPGYLAGTKILDPDDDGEYHTLIAVPPSMWGDIFMWRDGDGSGDEGTFRGQTGFLRSGSSKVQAWAYAIQSENTAGFKYNLKFGSGNDASGLNIRVKVVAADANHTWNYRISFRKMNGIGL